MTFLPTSAPARPFGLGLLCTLLLAIWLPAGAFAQSSPEELEVRIAEARATYESQRQALEGDYASYHEYLEEVAALEAEREAAGPFASDEAVRDARRLAREMALDLQGESETLFALTSEIRELQSELFEALDRRQAGLEETLPEASPEERSAIIAELLTISDTRDRHLEPLPAPPRVELDQIMLGLEDETTPEELEATAAELSDHERRLEEHLGEIERHILQIQLRERDREFRSEVSLFEEGQNSGRREERTTTAAAGGGQTNSGTAGRSSDAPEGGGDEVQAPPDAQGTDNGPANDRGAAGEDEGNGALDDDSLSGGGAPAEPSSDPGTGYDSEGVDGDDGRSGDMDGFTGAPVDTSDGTASPSDTPGFEPTPTPPSLAGVARPIRDPSQDVLWFTAGDGRSDQAERAPRNRLERLREERDDTAETLDEIRAERRRLLDRVQELEEAEGF